MTKKIGITKNGLKEICTVESKCKRHCLHINGSIKAEPLKDADLIDMTTNDLMEIFVDSNGHEVHVHSEGNCAGQHCSIHNPSSHPLTNAPLNWRDDRKMMERICAHGVGHPDPDDVSYNVMVLGKNEEVYSTHGCDGCCAAPTASDSKSKQHIVKESDLLPWTGMSLSEARSKLTGLHLSKEGLTDGEREILYIAEALLRQIDEGKA